MQWSRRRLLAATAGTAGLAGCLDGEGPTPTSPAAPPGSTVVYTHPQPGGNRVLDGRGAVADAAPVEIPVGGRPAWLLAFDGGAESYWTVVRADGTARTHRVADGTAEAVTDHGRVPTPPVGYRADEAVGLVATPDDAGAHTRPMVLDDGLLFVAADGDVVIRHSGTTTRLAVDAPGDARPVELGGGRYLLYGRRTDRYRHGALGDGTEPGSLVVVDAVAGRVETEIRLDAPLVFEGLSPLVAALDGDAGPAVVTTVADAGDGARVRVYRPDGTALATGPVHGSGWRHQLCVAPFAPDGTPELAVVRKPHVERVLEFYQLTDGNLGVVATLAGFASHTYGSRNLDGGLAGDLDDDGRTELLVPTTDRRELAAVRRTAGGATRAWSLALEDSLTTNLAGVALGDGRVAVGAGTVGRVHVWQG